MLFMGFLIGVSLAVWIVSGGQSVHAVCAFIKVNFIID